MLKRSADRKVTNQVSPNGKTAKIKNSFGLPSGTAFSCPGATSVCASVCYAGKLEKIYTGVKDILLHNWNALAGLSKTDIFWLLDEMVQEFKSDCDKSDKKSAKPVPRDFRIHWDGDFYSTDYATAWAEVIVCNPDVNFWVYTRSFTDALNVLPVFDSIDRTNLSLYLSVDSVNLSAAKIARKDFPWVKWAYLAETFADGKRDIADISTKLYPCPENGGRIELINTKGSACIRCGICVKGRGDVLFASRKR